MKPGPRMSRVLACVVILLCSSVPALSGVHLWRIEEVFSNADGTIQFIEMATCCGSTSEVFTGGQVLRSNANSFTFPANLSGSTLNKHILLGTSAFAALPGAPTPDQIIADHFFSTDTDTISFSVYDTLIFASGALPTDGVSSLNKDPNDATDTTFIAVNSPTNFADQTGSVNAAGGPPAVPDGTGGTTPLTVAVLARDGSSLRLSFDVASCTNSADHHILFGQRSGLPAALGGTFAPLGSVCRIGNAVPYDWAGVPDSIDGAGLIWFLVVTTDSGGVEGSWGVDSSGNERRGPGNGGASGTCAVVKNTANRCGHP